MATLKQIRDKADTQLAKFWVRLQQKQDAYFAKHGKYFQLLVSPENAVIDGVDSNFLVRTPSDEKFVLDRDFSFTEKVPFQIVVDEWVGKENAGYKATVYIQIADGRVFSRSRDNSNNDSGWFEVIQDDELV